MNAVTIISKPLQVFQTGYAGSGDTSLENELKGQLADSWIACPVDGSEAGVVNAGSRVVKVDVVENVEELRAELKFDTLCYREIADGCYRSPKGRSRIDGVRESTREEPRLSPS